MQGPFYQNHIFSKSYQQVDSALQSQIMVATRLNLHSAVHQKNHEGLLQVSAFVGVDVQGMHSAIWSLGYNGLTRIRGSTKHWQKKAHLGTLLAWQLHVMGPQLWLDSFKDMACWQPCIGTI